MKLGRKLLVLALVFLASLAIVACDRGETNVEIITITFDATGGVVVGAPSVDIEAGSAIGTLPTASLDHHNIIGWFTASEGGTRVTEETTFNTSTTVYAQWEVLADNQRVVTLNLHGGSLPGGELSIVVFVGEVVPNPGAAVKAQHVFEGWLDISGSIPVAWDFLTGVVNEDITLHASYNFDRSLAVTDTTLFTNFGVPSNINPINNTTTESANISDNLRSPFFVEHLNWTYAIANGMAQREFDFSRFSNYEGFLHLDQLGTTRSAGLAESLRAVTLDNTFLDANGVLDDAASRDSVDTVWELTLAPGNFFVDGAGFIRGEINADVFIYTVKIYLDPVMLNARADHVRVNMGIIGSDAYFSGTGTWEDVQIEKVDEYTIKFNGDRAQTHWVMMGWINLLFMIHPDQFDATIDPDTGLSSFGDNTPEDIPWSYGPFRLTDWQHNVEFRFTRVPTNFQVVQGHIPFANIIGAVRTGTAAHGQLEMMFRGNQLDSFSPGAQFWLRYQADPRLRVTPEAVAMRYVINTNRPGGGEPLLQQVDFRTALYLALNREELVEVRRPNAPALGFVSDLARPNQTTIAFRPYNESSQRLNMLEGLGLFPDQLGFNPDQANALFDSAFAAALSAGQITAGHVASIEITVWESADNMAEANWLANQWMSIFGANRLQVTVRATTSDPQWDLWISSGDFDLLRSGLGGAHGIGIASIWQVLQDNAFGNMHGWDFRTNQVEAFIPNIAGIIANTAEADRTPAMVNLLRFLDGATFRGTARELWGSFAGASGGSNIGTTDNPDIFEGSSELFVREYDGIDFDLNSIMAAIEGAFLVDMPAIPTFSGVSGIVFHERNVLLFPMSQFSLGWGGFRYRLVTAPLPAQTS